MRTRPIPAPWHYETTPQGNVTVYATRSGDDDKIIIGISQFGPLEQREANARHICNLVNEQPLESLKGALIEARDVLDGMNDDEINVELLPRINEVLARVSA